MYINTYIDMYTYTFCLHVYSSHSATFDVCGCLGGEESNEISKDTMHCGLARFLNGENKLLLSSLIPEIYMGEEKNCHSSHMQCS